MILVELELTFQELTQLFHLVCRFWLLIKVSLDGSRLQISLVLSSIDIVEDAPPESFVDSGFELESHGEQSLSFHPGFESIRIFYCVSLTVE